MNKDFGHLPIMNILGIEEYKLDNLNTKKHLLLLFTYTLLHNKYKTI